MGGLVAGAAGLANASAVALPLPPLSRVPPLLSRAKAALDSHSSRIRKRDLVGLVDFTVPSGSRRFQVVDLGNGRVLVDTYVAHGRGSDPGNTGMVQRFSNMPGSNASCQGSFLLGDTYVGKHGASRYLHGLDPENDLALARAIVIHGADYVSPAMASSSGRIGRSLGCFAVSQGEIARVLSLLGPGRLLYAMG